MKPYCAVPVFICGLLVLAQADIIPTGHKQVRHVVEFENISVYTNYYFFIYPRDLPRGISGNSTLSLREGVAELSALNPLAVGRNKGAYLYAVPKDFHLSSGEGYAVVDWFTNNVAGVLRSPRLTDPIRSLPTSDPRDTITNRYRLAGLPDKLDLIEVEASDSPAAKDNALRKGEIIGLLTMAGAAAVWLALTCRARKSPGRKG